MRYFITVSYDGSNYNGFQRLNALPSIQGELEKALTIINKKIVLIKGSGRTDRGVHAIGQVIHVDLNVDVPPVRLVNALNSLLPRDIRAIKCKIVNGEKHARFNVKCKFYKYLINMGEYDLFNNDYLFNYCHKLNIRDMKKASLYLIGKHDYRPFVSGYRENCDSEIYKIIFEKNKNILTIRFVGKSFYRYMVRNIVGALIMVGSGKVGIDDFKSLVDGVKKFTYMTVPSSGLYLERVLS